jgi:hypothetical protein
MIISEKVKLKSNLNNKLKEGILLNLFFEPFF